MNEYNFNTSQPYATAQQQTLQQQQQQQQQQMLFPQLQNAAQTPHSMPTPTAAPWNLDSMPWALATTTVAQPGGVMKFSGNSNNISSSSGGGSGVSISRSSSICSTVANTTPRRSQLHQKRKSELVPLVPPKQFISEEKITAHFNGLHISGDYVQSSTDNTYITNSNDMPSTSNNARAQLNYQVTAKELEEKLKKANRITVCEQIKKMQEEQKKASFLPEALLSRIVQPCTALVLWKPPPIVELLHQQQDGEMQTAVEMDKPDDFAYADVDVGNVYSEVDVADAEIDDFIDNNNTCSLDFNNLKPDGMDEDL